MLAATALGLGSALTTITVGFRDELRALLELPDHVVPVAVVPLGHPARALGPPRREPFASHTHRDHYGSALELPDALLGRLFAHDEHGARGVAHDVLARGAEEQA